MKFGTIVSLAVHAVAVGLIVWIDLEMSVPPPPRQLEVELAAATPEPPPPTPTPEPTPGPAPQRRPEPEPETAPEAEQPSPPIPPAPPPPPPDETAFPAPPPPPPPQQEAPPPAPVAPSPQPAAPPSAPPSAPEMRLGDDISVGEIRNNGRGASCKSARNRYPIYPSESLKRGDRGTVSLRLHINSQGDVILTEILATSGYAALDKAARDRLATWHCQPGTFFGKPVLDHFDVNITFAPE